MFKLRISTGTSLHYISLMKYQKICRVVHRKCRTSSDWTRRTATTTLIRCSRGRRQQVAVAFPNRWANHFMRRKWAKASATRCTRTLHRNSVNRNLRLLPRYFFKKKETIKTIFNNVKLIQFYLIFSRKSAT